MVYFYKCNKCNEIEEYQSPMSEKLPDYIQCECGGLKRQDFARKSKSLSFKTPESFKAGSPYAPKDYTADGGTDLEALGY